MVDGAKINAAKFASRFQHKLMKEKESLGVGFDWFSLSLRIDLGNVEVILFSDLSETFMVSHTRNEPKTEFKAVSLKTKK